MPCNALQSHTLYVAADGKSGIQAQITELRSMLSELMAGKVSVK